MNHPPPRLLIMFLAGSAMLAAPAFAFAGTIINRPLALGLERGLVGHWTFEGKDMYGTTALDRSGQGNNGTLTNGPTKTIGKIGQALKFDGVNDSVVLNSRTGFSIGSGAPWTLAAWVKTNVLDSSPHMIVSYGDNTEGHTPTLVLESNNKWRVSTWNLDVDANIQLPRIGTWTHVLGIGNGANLSIYVDGVLAGGPTAVTDNSPVNTNAQIGASSGGGFFFNGLIDDVRVYNRVLSPDEIKRLYNLGGTFKINKPANTGSLTNGLVGHWSFAENTMGTTSANDLSGNGNTGWLINGPTRTIGKIGQALKFDGANDYVDMGDPASGVLDFGTATDFSISAWARMSTFAVNHNIVFKTDENAAPPGYYLYVDSTGQVGLIIDGSSGRCSIRSTGSIALGTWQHITAKVIRRSSCTTNDVLLYVNGVSVSSSVIFNGVNTNTDVSNSVPLRIGVASDGGSLDEYFNGLIDDVRVYNRALSPDEIKRLYNLGGTLKINAPANTGSLDKGLVGHWTFEGKDMYGNTALDRSGQGNNGTLTNGPVKAIGKIGQALSFDGSDDNVSIPHQASQVPSEAIAISFWIKLFQYPTAINNSIIVKNGATGYRIRINSSVNTQLFLNNTLKISTSGTLGIGRWTHAVFVSDSTGSRTYLDGIQNNSSANAFEIGSPSSSIFLSGNDGTNDCSLGTCLSMMLDDVRIYNRALSPDEIKRLYLMGR